MLTTRVFDPALDYEMVCDWWMSHNRPVMPLAWLSSDGVVVESETQHVPIAVIWVYYAKQVPVCFAEQAVTIPGLPVDVAAAALSTACDRAQEHARTRGCEVMMLRAPLAIARYACRDNGFAMDERSIANMSCLLLAKKGAA